MPRSLKKRSAFLVSLHFFVTKTYDKENKKPVIKASICNGEQVAGFKDIHTGKIEEVMLIKSQADLEAFKKMYGIDGEIEKEY